MLKECLKSNIFINLLIDYQLQMYYKTNILNKNESSLIMRD